MHDYVTKIEKKIGSLNQPDSTTYLLFIASSRNFPGLNFTVVLAGI